MPQKQTITDLSLAAENVKNAKKSSQGESASESIVDLLTENTNTAQSDLNSSKKKKIKQFIS